MAHDVFICHSTADAQVAATICATLEAAGIRCWIAPRNVEAGPYAGQLVRAINGGLAFLLIFSAHANSSEHVLREVEVASSHKKVIVPFRIDAERPNVDLEYFTSRVHWLSQLNASFDERLDQLVSFLQRLIASNTRGEPIEFGQSDPTTPATEIATAQQNGVSTTHHEPARRASPPQAPTKTRNHRGNLVTTSAPLIGREVVISEVSHMLRRRQVVTIVGAPGTGKTRTAIEIAHKVERAYDDGVWLVELAHVTDPALLWNELASTFEAHDSPGETAEQTVLAFLRHRKSLIVLDNCEHLISEAASLAKTIARTCGDVRIIATSREPLNCSVEAILRLPTLSLPEGRTPSTLAEASRFESIALFIETARIANPQFSPTDADVPLLVDICRRLDGIALAIELAAARMKVLSLIQLDGLLGQRFRLLRSGARDVAERHVTLRTTIDWSYNLLDQATQRLFVRLGAFRGGCTLAAAVAVCTDEAETTNDDDREIEVLERLSELADKSLVEIDQPATEKRFRLLESMREYAEEKLAEASDARRTHERHTRWCLTFAREAERSWHTTPDLEWQHSVEMELANIRQALTRTIVDGSDPVAGAELACRLIEFWCSAHQREGRTWFSAALERLTPESDPHVIAALKLGLLRTEPEGAASLLEAAGAALLAYQSFPEDAGFGMALKLYGEELRLAGDTERANHHLNRALAFFRETGDRRRCALTLMALGVERRMRQENAAARTLYEEALLLARESNATAGLAKTQLLLAEIHMEEGDVTRAIASGRSAYETFAALNHRRFVAWAGCNLAGYLIHAGDLAGARTILLEALDALRDEPHPLFLVAIIEHSASVAALEGNHRKAARLLGFVERAVERWRIDREPLEQREHERLVIELSRLEQTELETLLGDGARLSEDSAFDETRALLCAR